MTALFEGGNTRLHFGWWDGEKVSDVFHAAYPETSAEWDTLLSRLFGARIPERVASCSVSPSHGEALFSMLRVVVPDGLTVFRTASDVGVRVRYEHPERFGIDRALAAMAAYRWFSASCVVVDAGTAITVDAVSGDGAVLGGYIIPGGDTMAFGLNGRTGLPLVRPGKPDCGLGTSTETCIGYGIAEALAGAVARLVGRAAESVAAGNRILLTGGDGAMIREVLPSVAEYRPELVLEGLGLASGM